MWGEGWGRGLVLCFPQDSKLWASPYATACFAPFMTSGSAGLSPTLHLSLLTIKVTMCRPGSVSGRIWSGSGSHPSSGSSPGDMGVAEEGLTRVPALDRGS